MNEDWKISVAILGARMHYAVPTILAAHGRLARFYTDWYLQESGLVGQIRNFMLHLPINSLRRAAMRSNTHLPADFIRSFPLLGLCYAVALRMSMDESAREKVYVRFGRKFAELVNHSGSDESNLVYGMNTASLEFFQAASLRSKVCILEQSIAPYVIMKQLIQEEQDLWNGWENRKKSEINTELAERERQEWDISHLILAGSEFVKNGLTTCGVPERKCVVLPYTMDLRSYKSKIFNKTEGTGLRVLFIGTVGLRKGIQYLNQALEMLKAGSVKAKAAGMVSLSPHAAHLVGQRIELLGLIPRAETHALWQWADVLVLPSICEGSALVTYEALASGVPVITTPNSGSPVQDGVTGYIIPNRNSEAIAERLEELAQNPELLRAMSIRARKYAEEHLSWEAYSQRLLRAIGTAVHNHAN